MIRVCGVIPVSEMDVIDDPLFWDEQGMQKQDKMGGEVDCEDSEGLAWIDAWTDDPNGQFRVDIDVDKNWIDAQKRRLGVKNIRLKLEACVPEAGESGGYWHASVVLIPKTGISVISVTYIYFQD